MKSIELDIKNLDKLIMYWRKAKINAEDEEDKLIASCYVDAYQTVRINHGLPLLPKDN